jgi:hypothetical protein
MAYREYIEIKIIWVVIKIVIPDQIGRVWQCILEIGKDSQLAYCN